jgi:hypothetical protein
MPLPQGKLVQASFFWKNDKPGGIGLTFGPPGFTSDELTFMFTGPRVAEYMRDSDKELGTRVVQDYLGQLSAIAAMPRPSLKFSYLAALNIMWLTERGFIPNDEYNGPLYVLAQE